MLKNKVVVVTGAGRGIGREIAIACAQAGALLIINYRSSEEEARGVAEEIKTDGGIAELFQADISKEEEAAQLIHYTVDKYQRLDVLVNNAGITKDNLLAKMSDEEFSQVLDINLKGSFYMMKHAVKPFILQSSGRIINISSVVGVKGNAGQVNYAASKAGIIGMTKSMAKEIGSRGITVNAVAPGFIDTSMTKQLPEHMLKGITDRIALKRIGNAREIADVVVFLASDKASYITGQVIEVDGGLQF